MNSEIESARLCDTDNRAAGLRDGQDQRGLYSSRKDLAWALKDWLDLDHDRKEEKAFQAAGKAKASSEAEMSRKCHSMP